MKAQSEVILENNLIRQLICLAYEAIKILEDVDFELELIHQDQINVAYNLIVHHANSTSTIRAVYR